MLFAPRWQPGGPARPLCAAGALVVVFGAIGIAPGVGRLSGPTPVDGENMEPPALAELATGVARRCLHCGWIESKRQILSGAADPHASAVYEYTVRMTDGSSSVFEQALPARWRVGERLTVVGAAR